MPLKVNMKTPVAKANVAEPVKKIGARIDTRKPFNANIVEVKDFSSLGTVLNGGSLLSNRIIDAEEVLSTEFQKRMRDALAPPSDAGSILRNLAADDHKTALGIDMGRVCALAHPSLASIADGLRTDISEIFSPGRDVTAIFPHVSSLSAVASFDERGPKRIDKNSPNESNHEDFSNQKYSKSRQRTDSSIFLTILIFLELFPIWFFPIREIYYTPPQYLSPPYVIEPQTPRSNYVWALMQSEFENTTIDAKAKSMLAEGAHSENTENRFRSRNGYKLIH